MRKQADLCQKVLKKAKYIEKIVNGLSNDNYFVITKHNEKLVVRIAKFDPLLDRNCEHDIVKAIAPFNIDVPCIYFDKTSGDKITIFQEGYHLDKYKKNDLKKVALLIKKFHSLKLKCTRDFESLEKLNSYYEKLTKKPFPLSKYSNLISKYQNYLEKDEKILCHNDIVKGNLLFTKEKLFLIDYEYAAMNSPMFDLVSFISENDIEDKESINYFLETYYQKVINDEIMQKFMTFYCFLDLLWGMWALAKYQESSEQIYYDIYLTKINRLDKNI